MTYIASRISFIVLFIAAGLVWLLVTAFGTTPLCADNYSCIDTLGFLLDPSVMLAPLLIPVIFTFVLNESVFVTLRRFLIWAVPISLGVLLLIPEYTGSDFLPAPGRGEFSVAFSVILLVTSLGIIVWKARR